MMKKRPTKFCIYLKQIPKAYFPYAMVQKKFEGRSSQNLSIFVRFQNCFNIASDLHFRKGQEKLFKESMSICKLKNKVMRLSLKTLASLEAVNMHRPKKMTGLYYSLKRLQHCNSSSRSPSTEAAKSSAAMAILADYFERTPVTFGSNPRLKRRPTPVTIGPNAGKERRTYGSDCLLPRYHHPPSSHHLRPPECRHVDVSPRPSDAAFDSVWRRPRKPHHSFRLRARDNTAFHRV